MASFTDRALRFAIAPARFAIRQSRTNMEALRALQSLHKFRQGHRRGAEPLH